jgi:hypothetical protein
MTMDYLLICSPGNIMFSSLNSIKICGSGERDLPGPTPGQRGILEEKLHHIQAGKCTICGLVLERNDLTEPSEVIRSSESRNSKDLNNFALVHTGCKLLERSRDHPGNKEACAPLEGLIQFGVHR